MPDQHAQDHWTKVYSEKSPESVSWYQKEPQPSLQALERLQLRPTSSFIDVGGGASNLADALLDRGWQDLTVLDIAQPALEASKERLGPGSANVHWEVADVTKWRPNRTFDIWHDRAVFHFLIEPEQRRAYREALLDGLNDSAVVLMATFALDGPERCSGLPVRRYDAEGLATEFEDGLRLVDSWRELHSTPWGSSQSFNWCAFERNQP